MSWEELAEKHQQQWQQLQGECDKRHEAFMIKRQKLWDAFYDFGIEMPIEIKEMLSDERIALREEYKWNGEKLISFRQAQAKEINDWVKVHRFKGYLKNVGVKDKRNREDKEL